MGDNELVALIEALRENDPEFDTVWQHAAPIGDCSDSAYDLSICSRLAHAGLDDATIIEVGRVHRLFHDPDDRKRKGRGRPDYWRRTLHNARMPVEDAVAAIVAVWPDLQPLIVDGVGRGRGLYCELLERGCPKNVAEDLADLITLQYDEVKRGRREPLYRYVDVHDVHHVHALRRLARKAAAA